MPLNRNTGLTSTKVLPAATAGSVKGLYIFGEDPIVTDPDTGHVRQALESLDFLVVQELFMTETAAYADVVLPGISYAEKDGHLQIQNGACKEFVKLLNQEDKREKTMKFL